MYDILQLNEMLVPELKDLAEKLNLKSYKRLGKQDLIYKILDHQALLGEDKMKQTLGDPKDAKASSEEKSTPEKKEAKPAPQKEQEHQDSQNKKIKKLKLHLQMK